MTDRHKPALLEATTAVVMSVVRMADPAPEAGPWPRRRPWASRPGWWAPAAWAEALRSTLPWPHLLFAVATIATIRIIGYHFGTFDQTLYIPLLKLSVDPTLYTADPFTALIPAHVSFFWDLFVPAYRAGVLEPVMFAAYILVTYLTFWSVWSLSQALFENKLASALSVVALTLPHFGLAGFAQIEFSLLARIAVLPFILWSLTLYLRGRYLAAFGLLGVLYNFHVLSVNYGLGLIVFASLTDLRRVGWRNLAAGLAVFVIAALPVLAWRASGTPIDFSLGWDLLALQARVGMMYMYFLLAPQPQVLLTTASFAAVVAMFFIARRRAPSSPHDRVAVRWMLAVLLVAAVEFVVSEWLPVTILIQLNLGRIGVYAVVLGYVYFAHYLAAAYQSGRLGRADLVALVLAVSLLPVAFLALALWALARWLPAGRLRPVVVGALALGLFGVSLLLAARQGLWDPRVQVEARPDAWYAAQVWARDHTPRQAVLITPPHLQGSFVPGWRVYSERATVATLDEAIDISNTPSYLPTWEARFAAVAPGALIHFRGDWTENRRLTADAFYGLTDAQMLAVAHRYGATYLVVERPHLRPWPVVYENEGFVIYDLRGELTP